MNMDISCDVIRDLLPMYVEELTSDASRELVDEHLRSCEECTRHLGVMRKAQVIPVNVEVESLKRVGNTIRRRRILAMLSVIMVVISLAASVYTWLTVQLHFLWRKRWCRLRKFRREVSVRRCLNIPAAISQRALV